MQTTATTNTTTATTSTEMPTQFQLTIVQTKCATADTCMDTNETLLRKMEEAGIATDGTEEQVSQARQGVLNQSQANYDSFPPAIGSEPWEVGDGVEYGESTDEASIKRFASDTAGISVTALTIGTYWNGGGISVDLDDLTDQAINTDDYILRADGAIVLRPAN